MLLKQRPYSNVALIGMPGAGKSTVGVILAKYATMDFVDTDLLIQVDEGRTLQQILEEDGYLQLRQIEEQVVLSLDCEQHVIATGGSVVYSPTAMQHLRANSICVFLDAPYKTLRLRVTDLDTRGIASAPGQNFHDVYVERIELYRQYADVTVDCSRLQIEEVADAVCRKLAL